MTSRPSTAAPILAVLAIMLALLGTYVGGYFWLGQVRPFISLSPASGISREGMNRVYQFKWLATAFAPLAKCESWATGKEVTTDSLDAQHLDIY
jgi:hypothetical protein